MNFTETVLSQAQQTFVSMYRQVHVKYFNNTVVSLMKRPYAYCSFESGVAEYYIPTVISPESRLQYHRIIIKAYETLEEQKVRDEVKALKKQVQKAPGFVDSETIILAARKANVKKIIRGFRHNMHCRGYMTLIVVAAKPKAAWVRIIALLKGFWLHRLKRLSKSLNVEMELLSEYLIVDVNSSNNNSNNFKIRNETLQTIFFSFVSTVRYLGDMLRIALLEISTEDPKFVAQL